MKVSKTDVAICDKLRDLGYEEWSFQPLSTGIDCCEDPKTAFVVSGCPYNLFLPQTRQMQMELVARGGQAPAVFTCDWSHRNEPRAGDGRHEKAFLLIEFERVYDGTETTGVESLVLDNMEVLHAAASSLPIRYRPNTWNTKVMPYRDAVKVAGIEYGEDIHPEAEAAILEACGKVNPVMVCSYPEHLCHFTMAQNPLQIGECLKVDVLLPGVGEAIGSAVRSTDRDYLRRRLFESSMYQGLVDKGMDPEAFSVYFSECDLSVPTYGGGVGTTRIAKWLTWCLKNIRN